MLRGERRLSELLISVADSGVDPRKLGNLHYYQKLKKLIRISDLGGILQNVDLNDSPLQNNCSESVSDNYPANSNSFRKVSHRRINNLKHSTSEKLTSNSIHTNCNSIISSGKPLRCDSIQYSKLLCNERQSGSDCLRNENPTSVPQIGSLEPSSSLKSSVWCVLQYLGVMIIGVMLYNAHLHQLWTHRGFSKFWLNWENVALEAEVVG